MNEDTENMEMPVPCDCGKWFDLTDGFASKKSNRTICEECHRQEQMFAEIENEEIRALTLKQPFADLMLHGKIETRTWSTNYRGYVLICAAQKGYTDKQVNEIVGGVQQRMDIYDRTDIFVGIGNEGNAIALGELVDCRPMKPEDAEKCFVKYQEGLYCHIYQNVRRIEPFPWKGSQGWRMLTDEQKENIRFL